MPVLTPRLSSYWVHLVTPIPSQIARPLIEGLRNEIVVRDHRRRDLFPTIQPVSYPTAVRAAVAAWTPARSRRAGRRPGDQRRRRQPRALTTQEGMLIERRQALVDATPDAVFARRPHHRRPARLARLGLGVASCAAPSTALVGGVGLRRGRRDPDDLRVGDALDFWRVEAVEPGRLLRLRAEMKVPGAAWLQFEALPHDGGTLLVQTAYFAPRGLPGLAYWYALLPVHSRIFSGMIAALAAEAGRPASPAGG